MSAGERSLFATSECHRQGAAAVRLDWGPEGLDAISDQADVIVIVDVLSFTTCVDIAVGRGATVFPFVFAWGTTTSTGRPHDATGQSNDHETAEEYATRVGALVANKGRHRTESHPWTLSPSNLTEIPSDTRLVLPSPNGSALSFAAAESAGTTVFAGCLRNASAVAEAATKAGRRISVIAGGERWRLERRPMRVSLEDHLGAGAIISAMSHRDPTLDLSPEARSAARLFDASTDDLRETMLSCVSGQELIERGFDQDVELAADLDASAVAPCLVDRAYQAVAP